MADLSQIDDAHGSQDSSHSPDGEHEAEPAGPHIENVFGKDREEYLVDAEKRDKGFYENDAQEKRL